MAKKNNSISNKDIKNAQKLMGKGPMGIAIVVIAVAIYYFTGVNVLDMFNQEPAQQTQQTQQAQKSTEKKQTTKSGTKQPSQTVEKAETTKTDTTTQEVAIPQISKGDIIDGTVTRVVDGDTILVKIAGESKDRRVRLVGVDTPETVHPDKPVQYYGKEASNFTKAQLTGKHVWLEYDAAPLDRYLRHLAYVWLAKPEQDYDKRLANEKAIRKDMYNARLILDGYARLMTIQPNSRYAKLFAIFQTEARNARRGLWENEEPEDEKQTKSKKKKS